MKECGHDELKALARIDDVPTSLLDHDPEVVLPVTANLAALAVDWMGFKDMIRRPEYRERLCELPGPGEDETAAQYIRRIWPLLEDEERGAALELGLQKMVTMKRVAETGIQVRVWRAFYSGEWLYGPSCPDTFAEWVRTTLLDSHSSKAEASYLYRLCEIIMWLVHNAVDGIELPNDLESCFRRPYYRRWRAVVSKLWVRITALEETPPDDETSEAILDEIIELVQAVHDEDRDTTDLDDMGIRHHSSVPPIVMEQDARDPASGLTMITATVSEAQLILLKQRMRTALDLRFQGEQYDTEDYDLVEYRIETRCWGDTEVSYNSRRAWDGSSWTEWGPVLDGQFPPPGNNIEGVLIDPELRLSYIRFWEKRNGHGQTISE